MCVLCNRKLAYVHCLLSLTAQRCVLCSQQTQGKSGATLNQLPVSFRCGPNFQQLQKKKKCDGPESQFEGFAYLKSGKSQRICERQSRKEPAGFWHKTSFYSTLGTLPSLSLIFHCATSFHREPQGVLFRARRHSQRDAGGGRAQAWFHHHLPLRQWLHTRGGPDSDLHHGERRQAELEQAQTHLHW